MINRIDHLINEEILKTCKYSVKGRKKLIMRENIEKNYICYDYIYYFCKKTELVHDYALKKDNF